MAQRWKQRPQNSNWGDFGPDDRRGRMNWVTREKVLQGVAEVQEGRSFCLSLPLDYPGGNVLNPRRHPPVLRPTLRNGKPNMNFQLGLDSPGLTDVITPRAIAKVRSSTTVTIIVPASTSRSSRGDPRNNFISSGTSAMP